jgi:hypothetical protein
VLGISKKNMEVRPMHRGMRTAQGESEQLLGDQWVGMVARSAPVDVAFVFAYMKDGQRWGGVNSARMDQIAKALQVLKLPWVIFADWNMLPAEVLEHLWVQAQGAKVVQAAGLEFTCHSGSGRCIDFGLCSSSLEGKVQV